MLPCILLALMFNTSDPNHQASSAVPMPSPAAAADSAAVGRPTVTVNICCYRNTNGVARVSLYNSAEAWLTTLGLKQEILAIKGPRMQVVFKDIPAGRYAVAVHHDENMNNKMDMKWFPFPEPAEGSGVTNNAEGKFGPPTYEASSFVLADKALTFNVLLRYF